MPPTKPTFTAPIVRPTPHPRWRRLENFIYPPKCILCGDIMPDAEEAVCPSCLDALPLTDSFSALRFGEHFSVCLSPLFYRGKLRRSFRRYKFYGQWQYAAYYSRWMMRIMAREGKSWKVDVVTWVPLNRWRQFRRGYDQTRLLAEPVARFLDRPLVRTLIKHPKRAQSQLGGRKRWENIKNAFSIHPKADVGEKNVLLVDDLITTGSTLEEAAQVLRAAGAERVYCLTLATSERHS